MQFVIDFYFFPSANFSAFNNFFFVKLKSYFFSVYVFKENRIMLMKSFKIHAYEILKFNEEAGENL